MNLNQVIELDNIIRPKNTVNTNPRVEQGASIVGGFDMQGGSLFQTNNVINVREERKVLPADYYLEDFHENYENYVEPEHIRKGISSTHMNYTYK